MQLVMQIGALVQNNAHYESDAWRPALSLIRILLVYTYKYFDNSFKIALTILKS